MGCDEPSLSNPKQSASQTEVTYPGNESHSALDGMAVHCSVEAAARMAKSATNITVLQDDPIQAALENCGLAAMDQRQKGWPVHFACSQSPTRRGRITNVNTEPN